MMIRTEGLTKVYPGPSREAPALRDVSLDVGAGEFVAVMGHSGSGKTTLLNIIGGLDRDYGGRVALEGVDLATMGDRELSSLRNRTIGFVFQAFHLLPNLTVLENVMLPACFGSADRDGSAPDRAREALERVGLQHRTGVRPTHLSAGERQRVAIARSVLNRPDLLLCDEPTGNLDAVTGDRVLDIFLELNREGTTLMVATHSERVAGAAGRQVTLAQGRVMEDPP